MSYRANLNQDLPTKYSPKRIIFYAKGLKVYGLLPHLLARRLRAEFFSNRYMKCPGLTTPTREENYTIVLYTQKLENSQKLLDWLYGDAGFLWAIAASEFWNDEIARANVFNELPEVWIPAERQETEKFVSVLSAANLQLVRELLCGSSR